MTTPTPLRVALTNGSFELPVVPEQWHLRPDASQTDQPDRVPGWYTTASDRLIELWRGYANVPAADGSQSAELNANEFSTLYQDLSTEPGTTLYWRLYHRGVRGEDTMAVEIGPPGAVVEQRRLTTGNTDWALYTGTYTVPPGQTTTRFALHSLTATGGSGHNGNVVDGVVFTNAPFVTLTKYAIPDGPLKAGDVLTYRVVVKNQGGGSAETLTLSDVIPSGTTYLPGSLRIVRGPNAGAKSDRTGDDQAWYDPAGNRVVFNLGNGATSGQGGSLPDIEALPDGTTVEYRVTIDETGAGGRLANTATATYENRLGPTPQPLTATSNEAVTDVLPAANLSITKSADNTSATVGQTVTYRVAVRNTGPNDATGITVTDTLPAGLTFLSATATAGGYDSTSGRWTVGALNVGAGATLILQAKAIAAGSVTNTATAHATETDLHPADNSDSVTVCVKPAPDCGPCDPCATRSSATR
jgi:uncharacterized repeat protein (TIGR01451 family)